MDSAPFYNDLAKGPESVSAHWRRTSDGVRLRVTHWPVADAKGTVILFNGRTEYAEKYGRIANDLTGAGFAVLTMDWRGQGLSDRIARDPRLGHVEGFASYQLDVAEFRSAAEALRCPEPWLMIGHSMGGCIGLRAIMNGFPVDRVVFSAPMWGIAMPPWVRPMPYIVPQILRLFGQGQRIAPGTVIENYILATAFEENLLTTDHDTYGYLARHAAARPEFALGGPSVDWVGYAARETRALRRSSRPDVRALTLLGSDEEIVSVPSIRRVHGNWPSGELRVIEGGRHELMMEAPAIRGRFLDETLQFLES